MSLEKTGGPRSFTRLDETLRERIRVQCGENFDPVVAMAYIAQFGAIPTANQDAPDEIVGYTVVDSKTRVDCFKEVAAYLYPKKKSVEISDPDGKPLKPALMVGFVRPETPKE